MNTKKKYEKAKCSSYQLEWSLKLICGVVKKSKKITVGTGHVETTDPALKQSAFYVTMISIICFVQACIIPLVVAHTTSVVPSSLE